MLYRYPFPMTWISVCRPMRKLMIIKREKIPSVEFFVLSFFASSTSRSLFSVTFGSIQEKT